MSQNVAPVRKVRVTSQQVAFLALTEGADAVATLHAKPGCEIAPATFDAAVDLLAGQPQVREALEALRSDLFGEGGSGERGRPAAKVGESRGYKVQQVGDSDPFIRLPVSLLGLSKGGTATVTFDNGVIRVKG
ncbi:hypothetical protein EBR66_07565 [bacterium]|nr:hypothetical protein [bacterium]